MTVVPRAIYDDAHVRSLSIASRGSSLSHVEMRPSSSVPGQKDLEGLYQRVAALEDRLGHIQALVIRAYEDTSGATVALLNARRHPSYANAYLPEPLVTVRIGTYAGDDVLFERALRSVRRQTYPNWEAIVVCDGQQASTAAHIASLRDPRIRCVQRPRNGPYPAERIARWQVAGVHPFNEAVALAQGSWIAPIDQDDEWSDDHLDVLLTAAQRTRAELAYGVARTVVANKDETYFGVWPPELGDFGFQASIYHAGLTTFLYDSNAHLIGEPADWNLARRMLEAGVRFEYVERIVATYYVHDKAPSVSWWRERVHARGAFRPVAGWTTTGESRPDA
jgi:glycosyltransferase involved in cell wall biosynthesis